MDYGLISIDADDHKLKSSFKKILIDEVNNFTCHNYVSATNDKISALLNEKIKFQVNPRKLNLFLIKDNKRYRLEYAKNSYNAVGSNLSFKKGEILEILNKNPEMFSPNVLMRPIYQEFLLPNLSYVGGGAEISYWLQLKSLFDYYKIPFPILTLRNSILLLNRRDIDFIDKNNIQISDLLRSKSLFIKNIINSNFKDNLNLDYEKKELKSIFKSLLKTATHVDKNLEAFVKSNETKQFKMVDSIEKKIIKSYKRKIEDLINSCEKIYDKANPDGILQERKINFSEYYSFIGKKMIKNIYDSIIPFDNKLIVIEI
jgi:bacillithiol biosynthesis cysteine-adding enzyme BshC